MPCTHTPTGPCLPALLPSPLQLCTSPEVAAGISAVYQLGELAVAVLLPFAARPPAGKLGCWYCVDMRAWSRVCVCKAGWSRATYG